MAFVPPKARDNDSAVRMGSPGWKACSEVARTVPSETVLSVGVVTGGEVLTRTPWSSFGSGGA
jgi:hypothetical protein